MKTAFDDVAAGKTDGDRAKTWREATYTESVDAVLTAEGLRSNMPIE